ncbi:MAG: non-homologous end-joining DNA ligase [Fimbriimonas sp.]
MDESVRLDGPTPPLSEYVAKRDFAQTNEPAAAVPTRPAGPLRFCIQKHDASRLHYDLRLELGGVLMSFAIPKGPSANPDDRRMAILTEDHPLLYLDFEEVIPKGQYGAGPMIVWDQGFYAPDEQGPPPWHDPAECERQIREDFAKGKLSLTFRGRKMKGSFALVRTKEQDQWLMLKHRDGLESDQDLLSDGRSVKTGRTIEQLAAGLTAEAIWADDLAKAPGARLRPMPLNLGPMLPTDRSTPFRHEQWTFELKLDGIRVLALIEPDQVRLLSRNGHDISDRFPSLVADLRASVPVRAILDGEIILNDETGKPNFKLLMQRFQTTEPHEIARWENTRPIQFFAFDVLYLAGWDLRGCPWSDRRATLERLRLGWGAVRLLDTYAEVGDLLFQQASAMGLEGIVGKRMNSIYRDGERSADWIKVKQSHSEDFLVVGMSAGTGARASTWGALVLARPRDMAYCGAVGTGFTDDDISALHRLLSPLVMDQPSISNVEKAREDYGPKDFAGIRWVRPEVIVEVRYGDIINDKLRFPVFVRLRPDLQVHSGTPIDVHPAAESETTPTDEILNQLEVAKREEIELKVEGERFRVTNLNRVFWPGGDGFAQVTKRDLLIYLARVAPVMVPHLRQRPLSVVRCPGGIDGEVFFQKHWEKGFPEFVRKVPIFSDHNGRAVDYLLCENTATLVWLAQMAGLELHPWYSRTNPEPEGTFGTDFSSSPEALDLSCLSFPDFMVFDLDPFIPEGQERNPAARLDGWKQAVEVGLALREQLETLGLRAYPKSSGKSGLHVFLPLVRKLDYGVVRSLAETMGRFLLTKTAAIMTMEWVVKKRPQKVFFDHNQNVRGKTLVSVYSPRPVPGAPVSFPLRWEELESTNPANLTVFSAPERIQSVGDLWLPTLTDRQSFPGT